MVDGDEGMRDSAKRKQQVDIVCVRDEGKKGRRRRKKGRREKRKREEETATVNITLEDSSARRKVRIQ